MDRNTVIGLTLIFILFIVWQQVMGPSPEEIERQQRQRDSLARIEAAQESSPPEQSAEALTAPEEVQRTTVDTVSSQRLLASFGPFAPAAAGSQENYTLENDLFRITFSNKGGKISEVELKEHFVIEEDENFNETKVPLKLLEDEKNRFEYLLPVSSVETGKVSTEDLFFTATQSDTGIVFRAATNDGRFIEQQYSISPGTYKIDYKLRMKGLSGVVDANTESIELNWINFLSKLERNTQYERNYSTLYFKPVSDDMDYCSCRSDDIEELDEQRVKWVSNANQFFASSLLADKRSFNSAYLETQMLDPEAEDLKKLQTRLQVPFEGRENEQFDMTLYVGPNEFDRLLALGYDMEYIIPYGSSIFGTINRWVIRPLFNFLSTFIGGKGIVILALTVIVKLLLFPLTYRMLYSQSKMGALKPRLEGLKEKYKDDSQKQQMETMKIYREFGVNPLGGCMPMVLQMPIWFALYRFFPAAIEFRQASFLWATDLSSYDVAFRLPFEIPFGFGAHISAFTLLWAGTTLIYTYYNTKHMDMSANPAMKYMQYLMPIFFLGFFNSFASGLTAYLLFSNLFNIAQTIVTKNYIIDKEKIEEELEAYRKKPKKKKSKFAARLEEALKEQQKAQDKKKKKR
ncbi:MAG: membrane protein insertase YidC [Saprospiraceae bacterium]|nr:membrane protein insertase YidC [Saprospiraceae bacterium]